MSKFTTLIPIAAFLFSCTASDKVDVTAPEISAVVIDQNQAYINSTLICSATLREVYDPAPLFFYSWTNPAGEELSTLDSITLTADMIQPSEALTCTVTVRNQEGLESSSSTSITISNTDPVIDEIVIFPDDVRTDSLIECVASASDIDASSLDYTYEWKLGDTFYGEGAELDLSLISIETNAELSCQVTVTDANGGVAQGSQDVVFTNLPPVLESLAFAPPVAYTSTELHCDAALVAQFNGEQVTKQYVWEKNGVLQSEEGAYLSPPFEVGDQIACTVTPNDGTQDGESLRVEIEISNTLPTIDSLEVTPQEPYLNDTAYCVGQGSDENGDSLSYAYLWEDANGNTLGTYNQLQLDDSLLAAGDEIVCVLQLTDSHGGIVESRQSVTIQNSAPVVESLSAVPTSVKVGETVSCTASVTDADGDAFTEEYLWTDSTGTILSQNAALVIDASDTERGDVLTCTLTVSDGSNTIDQTTLAYVLNSEPEITSLVLSPAVAYSYSDITCVPTIEDPDLDSTSSTYIWKEDGVTQGIVGDTLFGPFAVGSEIICLAQPDDGVSQGTQQQVQLHIQNSPPEVTSVHISPSDVLSNTALSCQAEVTDVDSEVSDYAEELTTTYTWLDANGNIIGGSASLQLDPSFAQTGAEFSCVATVNDAMGEQATQTAVVTVVNSDPYFETAVSIQSTSTDARVGDVLTCFAKITDLQDGALDITYAWRDQNDQLIGSDSELVVTAGNSDPGSEFSCTVSATDSDGVALSDSVSIVISNSLPSVDSVTLSPSILYSNDEYLACLAGSSEDADEESVSFIYEWFVDGTAVSETSAVLMRPFDVASNIECRVTPTDVSDSGTPVSDSLIVSNTDPVIDSISISPNTQILITTTLTCSASASDEDNQTVDISYQWKDQNGIILATDAILTLNSDISNAGAISCTAIADDGFGGVVEDTTSVEIENSLPEWSEEVSITAVDSDNVATTLVQTGAVLTCSATATDLDEGEITPTYDWSIGGLTVATGAVFTVDPSITDVGDTLLCTATASDAVGEVIESSDSISIANTAPIVTVAITPDPADRGDTLTCSATVDDPDQQDISYSYVWKKNSIIQSDWSNLPSVSGSLSRNSIIECIVTPNDGVDSGSVESDSITISNGAPVVSELVFNDTVVYTDGLIQVVATSSDVDEDTYTLYYDWYTIDPQTGAETQVQSSVSNELDGSLFAKDEQVYVSVYGDDGLDGGIGTPLESEHITILNTAPQAPTITITPTYPVPESDIVCEVTADSFDLDGDAITYSATWTKDDVSFTSATTTNFSGDTIPSSDLNSGERWVCTVTPNDGDEEGATETAYTTIGGGQLFDGDIGASWEILSSSPSNLFSLMTYRTNDFSYLWNASGDYLSYYDPDIDAWDYIDVVTPYTSAAFRSMAPVKEDLWMIRNESVYKYSVLDNTWTTLNTYTGGDDLNMTTSDYAGNVYGYAASGEIVVYNIPTDTVTQYSTGLGSVYETRMTYDPTVEAIFFGAYNEPDLYRFDLDTQTTTVLTPIPSSEYQLNNIFCGDRSGHIYVAGGYNNYTMYRYTISSDEWERIPDLPFDHGNNGSCSVSEDGFLYVGTGTSLGLYRIFLGMN